MNLFLTLHFLMECLFGYSQCLRIPFEMYCLNKELRYSNFTILLHYYWLSVVVNARLVIA
eukprot:c53135_g1_i1 orf=2-178(-)